MATTGCRWSKLVLVQQEVTKERVALCPLEAVGLMGTKYAICRFRT